MAASLIPSSQFDSIPDTIEAFRRGEFILVLDDPSRENEADLIIAAEHLTTEKMAWMVRYSSGLICAPIMPSRADALALPVMVPASQDARGTAYTISVDAAHPSVTTGISAHDRTLCCRFLADPQSRAESFIRPGHILPLRAAPGGVRQRTGHTEAAIEFCRLAGLNPAAAIAELVEDGEPNPGEPLITRAGMMRGEDNIRFARKWGLKVCTIADLVQYVEKTEGKLNSSAS
ncbi:3,4-dihydroxy 2-butanone 4-phosphate synthase [Claviceps sp. LM220 group G6]|nr:3,4-dihydroxy 2-butanone 4-phosphate synthase [Claviceps sp. LM218 group G6]KAG6101722.1 3,4-dihydroxy 2-butanone 4-phosphate synthase [Claviceps sp. LM220 group G6]KAG6112335.1 3,4-dihydroxy 2-butanone 4-phosphate synthase [Claviceps sp. LM219 group G6]KAG6114420.1 3,4-dihydroxy 2-butanone 4-phosphate synthase [Claviceps sp. LM454 group G7]